MSDSLTRSGIYTGDWPIKIASLTQTCGVCPSQWEGRTDDDRGVYIRYRGGHLTVGLSEPGGTVDDAVMADVAYCEAGHALDGDMGATELSVICAPDILLPETYDD